MLSCLNCFRLLHCIFCCLTRFSSSKLSFVVFVFEFEKLKVFLGCFCCFSQLNNVLGCNMLFTVFLDFFKEKDKELAEFAVGCVTLISLFLSLRLFRLSDLFRVVSHVRFVVHSGSLLCKF